MTDRYLNYSTILEVKPRLGRISAACAVLGIALYAIAIVIGNSVMNTSDPIDDTIGIALYALFFVGLAAGIAAVARRRSRTALAWVGLSISAAIWLFFIVTFLAGM